MIEVTESDFARSILICTTKNQTYPISEFYLDNITNSNELANAALNTFRWLADNNLLTHNANFEVKVKDTAIISVITYCSDFITQSMKDVLFESGAELCSLIGAEEDWTLAITPLTNY